MRLSLDLHHGRPQQLALEAVAGPHDFGHNRFALALLVGDSVVLVGIERLADGIDALEALLPEGRHELTLHLVETLAAVGERQVEGVEHREQLLDETLSSALEVLGLLLEDPLL